MPKSLQPIAVAFTALGTFFGTWAVVAADVEDALGVGHGGFGLLLALALLGTAAMGAVTGALVDRWGVARVVAGGASGFAAMTAALALVGDSGSFALLVAAIVGTFMCSGVVDVGMNVAATAVLVGRPGRLVRFHAFFNVGAALGAGLTAVIVHFGEGWRLALFVPAAAMAITALVGRRADIPVGESGEHPGLLHAIKTVRSERLVGLAVVFALATMVEGGIDTWGVLVLRDQLTIGIVVGATAQMVGQTVAASARATLGPMAGEMGTVRGIALGAGLAAVGLLLVAVAPAPLAVVGLVAGAAGVSVCWPMLLAHASHGLDRPAAVVSGVTAIGYLGFVLGPAVIGFLAGLTNLRMALLVLAAAAAVVAVAPRRLRVAGAPPRN